MKRQQFLFRPNPHSDLHQRAWAYLQTCPTGQKNYYIAWAIIRLESQKEFENILREILKEPEAVPHESVRAHRSSAASTIPGEMHRIFISIDKTMKCRCAGRNSLTKEKPSKPKGGTDAYILRKYGKSKQVR